MSASHPTPAERANAAARRLGLSDRVCVQCGSDFQSDEPFRLCDRCADGPA